MTRYEPFIKHQHTVWDKFTGKKEFQEMLQELSTPEPIKNGQLVEISRQTGVPKNTLKTWRRKLKKNKSYVPEHGRINKEIALPRDVVERFIANAKIKYVDPGMFLPPSCFASLAREIGQQENPNFKASRSWVQRVLAEHNLSFRKPHVRRRTEPDDSWIAAFTADVDAAKMQYDEELIFNADETFWRVVNGELKTLAIRGSDHVTIDAVSDEKEGVTVMVTANMAGQILPPCMIAKGKTARAEQRYRNDPRLRHLLQSRRLFIGHSRNGWMNETLAMEYLEFLSGQVEGRHCFLIWDVHSSHRTVNVKKKAEELGIGMSFVPAGQTPNWQPLDNKLFGMIKKQAHTRFNDLALRKQTIDLIDALVILIDVINSTPTETVRKAWNMFRDGKDPDIANS